MRSFTDEPTTVRFVGAFLGAATPPATLRFLWADATSTPDERPKLTASCPVARRPRQIGGLVSLTGHRNCQSASKFAPRLKSSLMLDIFRRRF